MYPSDCSSLNHFDFIDVLFSVQRPDWRKVFYLNNTKDGSQHSLALYFSMWGCGQIQLHPKTSGVFYNIRFQHDRIFFPELTDHGFSQKHSVGLEDEARLLRRRVLEPDLVPDDAVDTRV